MITTGRKRNWLSAAVVTGCAMLLLVASRPRDVRYQVFAAPKQELFWPPLKQEARIQYLAEFQTAKDLKLKRHSALAAVLRKIIGLEDGEPRMVAPYGMASDSQGRLIVADTRLRAVHVFDFARRRYELLRTKGREAMVSPVGVAVDGADTIYVSDSYLGKVFVFRADGRLKKVLGEPEGQYKRPTGIAIDKAAGRLYVVETLRNNVLALDLEGREQFRFGGRGEGEGEFNAPTQICVAGGQVLVTDTLNGRVQRFSMEGKYLGRVGRFGNGPGLLDKPKGISLDSEGHIYVVEGLHDVVQVFDREGRFLLDFGSTGSGPGQFYLATGIHIDASNRIFVADARRIQVFQYLARSGEAGD